MSSLTVISKFISRAHSWLNTTVGQESCKDDILAFILTKDKIKIGSCESTKSSLSTRSDITFHWLHGITDLCTKCSLLEDLSFFNSCEDAIWFTVDFAMSLFIHSIEVRRILFLEQSRDKSHLNVFVVAFPYIHDMSSLRKYCSHLTSSNTIGTWITVQPAARAASRSALLFSRVLVSAIQPFTASWSAPPSVVNSFWYSMKTTPVSLGSSVRGVSSAMVDFQIWTLNSLEKSLQRNYISFYVLQLISKVSLKEDKGIYLSWSFWNNIFRLLHFDHQSVR